ncbi:peptidase inhibitor family I36 protein [Micromonospora sp. SL1-18]|uniref:peptidase inhibitor family I36 protein n=1 Tax=Micromonospora sp. SL1-18 TaxID=3399128 RepID=UPI003A4D6750
MRSPKRILAAIFTTTTFTALAIVGTAEAASAEPCPSGATCAYAWINYDAHAGPVYGDNEDLGRYYQWTGAESIYNNGVHCDVYIYSAMFYGGTRYPLAKGSGWTNIYGKAIWHHALSNKWYNCR